MKTYATLTTVAGQPLSRIGLGTWGLGGIYYGEVPDDLGIATVRAYIDAGGNHIDTAYAYHKSEEVIGQALKGYDRGNLFITSKTYAGCDHPDELKDVREHVEISLRDLGVDYLDCYLIHGTPNDPDHLNRLIDTFGELKDEGKIRAIGASIKGPSIDHQSLATALLAAEIGRIEVIQLSYSIARQLHAKAIATAAANGVAVIARWVIESGMLTGKYPLGQEYPWPDTRNRYLPPQRDGILQIGLDLQDMLPKGFASPRELAVGFALAQPGVTGLILGANKPEHARANVVLAGLPPVPQATLEELCHRYAHRNDAFNPTGEFEHVPSPRRPIED